MGGFGDRRATSLTEALRAVARWLMPAPARRHEVDLPQEPAAAADVSRTPSAATLATLAALLDGPLDGLFRGVHVLPPFPSSGDRGFAPTGYSQIDPRFGSWVDIEELASTHDVLLDVMVNHISRHSPEFQAFEHEGSAITDRRSLPHPGQGLARRRAARLTTSPVSSSAGVRGPFSTFTTDDGERVTVWTTFGEGEVSEQIDLDLRSPAARELVGGVVRGPRRRTASR